MTNSQQVFITIHGHFYQPPRENPWTEQIEKQESAFPFHDWNERINKECYHANCFARILNAKGNIENIINNFQYISFNVGPTLMKWIREHSAKTYRAIINADLKSRDLFSGHGNAIAQVYNHVILPLASKEDKYTQILWGIEDFKAHFHRNPESIWLAETAINQETIDVLVDFNLKYIILSPFQACRIRSLLTSPWVNVNDGSIDTTMPYRHYSSDGRFIDIFFYNAAISSAIGFEQLLTNSYRLVEKFQQFIWNAGRPILITACTDGETYGHHKKFGDMCLAHFITHSSIKSGLSFTNFGWFLEQHPPTYEVQIKPGHDNEGTSWSCAHGVDRWIRNCGCSDGGYPSWNQHWRTPLRIAFNWLHDEILKACHLHVNHLIKNLAEAKNDYFHVINNRTRDVRQRFIERHCIEPQIAEEKSIIIFRFMEALHQCQLMFTSCAWFFADVARLEPIQNMKYAARAIQLVKKYINFDLEQEFLDKLHLSRSNNPEAGTGKEIYQRDVKPSIINYKMIVSNYAIESFVLNQFQQRHIYEYTIEPVSLEKRKDVAKPMEKGMVWLYDNYTGEQRGYIYFLFMESLQNVRCYTLNNTESLEFNITTIETNEDEIKSLANGRFYTLKDLFIENREQIIKLAFSEQMKQIKSMLERLYDKNIDLLETFHEVGLPIPDILKTICEYVYTNRVSEMLDTQKLKSGNIESSSIVEAFQYTNRLDLRMDIEKVKTDIYELLNHQLGLLKKSSSNYHAAENIMNMLTLAEKIALPLNIDDFTIDVFELIAQNFNDSKIPNAVQELANKLKIETLKKIKPSA